MFYDSERELLVEEIINRGIANVYPSVDFVKKQLLNGKQLRVYLGIDPTAVDIHIGHAVSLLFLKRIHKLGHKPVILIGDFTARIGDPTDKEATRKQLTKEDVAKNMQTYWQQIERLLPGIEFEKRFNSEWYEDMRLDDFMRLASQATVQQMLTRDMFQRRIATDKPIGVHELMYPLLQGYDSVALKIDGEVGGNDQTFNMLVGRDLAKSANNTEKIVFAMRLIEDPLTGKKMSKTENNYIALTDDAETMFGKTMSFSDAMIPVIAELATDLEWTEVKNIKQRLQAGENPRDVKLDVAQALTALYHGNRAAQETRDNFINVFSAGQQPQELAEFNGAGQGIIELMIATGLSESRSESKRLIEQGAVSINGEVINNWDTKVDGDSIIKVGPHRFIKIK